MLSSGLQEGIFTHNNPKYSLDWGGKKGRNKDLRSRVNSFLSESDLTHGMCVEFI